MKQYALVIFDLDGTILDTLDDLTQSLNYALEAVGFPRRTRDEVRQFVGNGIRKLMERAVPTDTDEAQIDAVHTAFTAHYTQHCADCTKPYDGIPELLKQLRQQSVKLAVVSNKADYAVQALCQQYFPDTFDFVVGERTGIRKKPAPDSVIEVLNTLNIPKEHAVYIGDSDVDVQTAGNAGMDVIGVSWGFRGHAFLAEHGADCIADTVEALGGMLLS